jgi:hypothetical protein
MEEVEPTDASQSGPKSCGSVHRQDQSISRKISVAPMMDWIDEANPTIKIIDLGAAKMACLLYVSSAHTSRDSKRASFARGAGGE